MTKSASSTAVRPLRSLTRAELLLLGMLAMVQFTHIVDFMIMMPLGPQLIRSFDISTGQFGFLVSSYTFSAGLTGFLASFVMDRFDRRSTLLFSYFGFTIGTLACALAPNYELLLFARALAGAFGGVLGALILAIIGDSIPSDKRGRAMGIVMGSFSLASVFGVPFGVYLTTLFSWHAPFVFVGGVGVLNFVLLMFALPNMKGHMTGAKKEAISFAPLMRIMSDRNQVKALLLTCLLMLSQFVLVPFMNPYLVANVGFAESQLALIYFIGGGLTVFTSPFGGKLADRYGRARVFTVASVLLLIPNLIITHMGVSPMWWALTATSMMFVLGNFRFVPAMAMVTSAVRSDTRGSFMSINSCVQSLGTGAAALIAGFIVTKTQDGHLIRYDMVGYLSVILSLVAIWLGNRIQSLPELHPADEREVEAALS